jgi:hypothetical protein
MISNKLLSAILNKKCVIVDFIKETNNLYYQTDCNIGTELRNKECWINVYELSERCKQWAFIKWYSIESSIDSDGFDEQDNIEWVYYVYLSDLKNIEHIGNRNKFIKEFKAKTEPEAIFKACEWILENKDYK